MYIQEEQEYTTNEGADVLQESSCQCDTDEDRNRNSTFAKDYLRERHDEESEVDSEVLLSSPKHYLKRPKNISRHLYN